MGIKDLENVVNEMDVQDRYRVAFRNAFKDIQFRSEYRCDGLAYSEKNKLRMIIEQKHGYNFTSIVERAKVVSQVIRYIKTIHDQDPKIMPKVAVIGDENECFVLPVKDIINYISVKEYNWSLSPSSMHQDKVLVDDLTEDKVIKELYIYKPQNEFGEIVNKIKDINKGISVPRTLTEKNIDKVYQYFTDKITLKRLGKKILPNDSVNLFAHIMLHPNSVMLNNHTKQLFTGMFKEPLAVSNVESYNSFTSEFSRTYTPKQKHIFTAILDRLIEDVTRRKQGEFFTPTKWVNKSHEYIGSVYGEDWKEKYIVWDPAWGTGNLTRDYKFKELYVTTLNQSDIDTADQMGYNPEAVKTQYDFLNDDYEKLPIGLRSALESGQKVIVLMNPPYGRANGESKLGTISKGGTTTKMSQSMKIEKYGGASSQLYAQFLYRLMKLGVSNICIFSKSLYKTSETYKKFRQEFYSNYKFDGGFLFKCSEFADVSDSWAVDFSMFSEGIQISETKMDVLIKNDSGINKLSEKLLGSTDNRITLSEWVKFEKQIVVDFPKLSSALLVKETNYGFGKPTNCFATLVSNANNVAKNANSVYIVNGGVGENVGKVYVNSETFMKSCCVFSARKLIKGDWLNDKDEYYAPNENELDFGQFSYDSVIISLFNNSSEQSSLRGVTYKFQIWNITNQFFWMSKNEMTELANQNNYNELYNDVRTDSDRYVHTLLFGEGGIYNQLSDEAKDVLDSASNLVRLSIAMRSDFANDTNHLNSWDAGYAQLKLLWKEYYPEQFKEFRAKYKVLEDKMRPKVYELGFLLK